MNWKLLWEKRRTELLLAGATVGLLLPFLNKAFDIDEPLFLWIAQQIARHPLNPYGFEVNWGGFAQPMSVPMQNPPLCSYYIAAAATCFGWSEPALHAAFLLPAVAAILGTYAVARRLCAHPGLAASLSLLTPVFLISASSVMCDVMLLAFWLWAIALWIAGLERRERWMLACSGLLIAASTLTKYFGINLVPLLLLYSLARERRLTTLLLYLAIPLLTLVAYELATNATYGTRMFSSALLFLRDTNAAVKPPLLRSFIIGCSFSGGCMLTALFFLPLRRAILCGAVLLAGVMIFFFARLVAGPGAFGANGMAVMIEGGCFAAAGAGLLMLAVTHCARQRNAESLLLLGWIAGTFLFASFINWSITARTILPMVPAAAILLVRTFDAAGVAWSTKSLPWRFAAVALCSLALVNADYWQADASRSAARHYRNRFSATGATVWFQSHWGFQYYMQTWGAQAVTDTTEYRPGDLLVIPSNNADPRPISREFFVREDQFEIALPPLLTTFAPGTGAAFYSHARGPVPWLLGRVPPQTWEAVQAKER